MKIRHWFIGIVALAALVPGAGWGASTVTTSADSGTREAHDSAGGGKPRAQHGNDKSDQTARRQHKGPAVAKQAQKGGSKPSRKVRGYGVALTPSRHTVAAVSGNAVARHTPVKAGVGGPTNSDAKHGALVIVGSTAMNGGRHFRAGDGQ